MILEKPSDYPDKYFSFVGNVTLPNKTYRGNDFKDYSWEKTNMEDWIIDYYEEWRKMGDAQ